MTAPSESTALFEDIAHLRAVERLRCLRPIDDPAAVSDAALATTSLAQGGLGRLDDLLADPAIGEIMINGPGPVWVERSGRLSPSEVDLDQHHIEVLIERILTPLGLRADRTAPIVDARLDDGSRVSIVLPPLSLGGPTLTVRKFSSRCLTLADFGPPPVVSLLTQLVDERATVLVVGPTSSGKTSLLAAMIARCASSERILCIEDTAELAIEGPNRVRLEARPANSEGVGEVTLRQLVRAALRMRPDRLVIGEVRGAEAFDLILALSSGHTGSFATCHAVGALGALDRLEALAALAGVPLSSDVAARFVRQSLDVVVVVGRVGASGRRVEQIAQVPTDTTKPLLSLWPPC